MALSVSLHGINKVTVNHYEHDGPKAAITFYSGAQSIKLFVPPHVADALKLAWDSADVAAAEAEVQAEAGAAT